MQGDNLERFIRDHREAFDEAVPSLNVWAGIEETLDQRGRGAKVVTLWPRLRAIAAAIALLIVGGGIGSYLTQSQQSAVAALEEVAPEYAEMEQYYQGQISEKYQQLVSYQKEQLVSSDLEQLDAVMNELKEELSVAPRGKEEQIVENLIVSYQTKIQILERVLERIQTTKQNQEDDEISI